MRHMMVVELTLIRSVPVVEGLSSPLVALRPAVQRAKENQTRDSHPDWIEE